MTSSFFIKSAGKLGVASAVGTGGYFLYDSYVPKKLEDWARLEGLDSTKNDDVSYKTLYVDFSEELSKKVDSIKGTESVENGFVSLKKWCESKGKSHYSRSKKKEYDDFKKYCFEKLLTVKSALIKSKKTEFEQDLTDEQYKTIFAVYKYDGAFVDLLNEEVEGSISNSTDNETGKGKLKDWCEKNLKKHQRGDQDPTIKNVFFYCSPPNYSTVEDKLTSGGFTKITDTDSWRGQFKKWKNTSDIVESIKINIGDSSLSSDTDDSTGGPKMQQWCEEGLKKKLYDSNVYQELYLKIKSACSAS